MITVETAEEYHYILNCLFSVMVISFLLKITRDKDYPRLYFFDEKIDLDLDVDKLIEINDMLIRRKELSGDRDTHNRYIPQDTEEGKHRPFDEYVSKLYMKIKNYAMSQDLPIARKWFWPEGKKFAICLTHDIDQIRTPLRYLAKGALYFLKRGNIHKALKRFFELITYKNAWNIKQIVQIEESLGVKSTFFFLINRTSKYDGMNSKKTTYSEIQKLAELGIDIQLHGSYNSYNNEQLLRQEKTQLEKLSKRDVIGIRQHYLRFEVPVTWEIQDKLGFKYDTTLGFADNIGFRAGISFPFHPINVQNNKIFNILEIPLAIMDTALAGYMKISAKEAWKKISSLISSVEQHNGLVTLLWHNKFFDKVAWADWHNLYKKILGYGLEKNAFLGSATQVYNWWIQRENANFEATLVKDKSKVIWKIIGFSSLYVEYVLPENWFIKVNGKEFTGTFLLPTEKAMEIIAIRK